MINEKDRERFRELLLEERREIYENLISDDEALNQLHGFDEGDLADQAYTRYEKDFVLGMSRTEQETIKQIDNALKRLDNGTFGLCEVCNEEIEKDRLEVIPYTTLCIKHAKEKAKKRGH